MKAKPDVSAFAVPPKDPSAFLDGAREETETRRVAAHLPPAPISSEVSDLEAPAIESQAPESTVQKNLRIRWRAAMLLKDAAAAQTKRAQRRVTETEILEGLILKHLKQLK